MKSTKDLLAVKLDDGRTVVVSAPTGQAFEDYLVEDNLGRIGRVINKETDYNGNLKKFLAQFQTVYKANRVWMVAWESEEVKPNA
jgi:hypothetical protein